MMYCTMVTESPAQKEPAAGSVSVRLHWSGQRQVALEHVHRILLEREDGGVIEHAQQGDQPEAEAREDGADVLDPERIVLLLRFAGLAVELAVHEEIGDEHDQADAQEHNAEGDGTADIDMAAELGEIRREDHAGGDAKARQGHFRAHREGRLPALEPLDDTAAHRDAGHFAATAEDHESEGRQLGGGRHTLIERKYIVNEAHAGVPVQVVGEPGEQSGSSERIADGVPLDKAANEHDRA